MFRPLAPTKGNDEVSELLSGLQKVRQKERTDPVLRSHRLMKGDIFVLLLGITFIWCGDSSLKIGGLWEEGKWYW